MAKSKLTVVIEEKAFLGIFLASVEAFPTRFRPHQRRRPNGTSPEGEVHGLLFGQRIEYLNGTTTFNVTLAVPNQIICERKADGIMPSVVHIERIRDVIEMFPSYQYLGCFHSHPETSKDFHKKRTVEFSKTDEISVLGNAADLGKSQIEVIFGLTCQERRTAIQPEFIDSHIIHNCCGVYKYSLASYFAEPDSDNLVSVDNLICTTAAGMHFMDFK